MGEILKGMKYAISYKVVPTGGGQRRVEYSFSGESSKTVGSKERFNSCLKETLEGFSSITGEFDGIVSRMIAHGSLTGSLEIIIAEPEKT